MHGKSKTLAAKHLFACCVIATAISSLTVACNATTRYRVLSFFFDGVPNPEEPASGSEERTGDVQPDSAAEAGAVDSTRPIVVARTIFSHPPFREFQCRRCHEPAGVELVSTPQQGLCKHCHPGVPGDDRYVHGPVAVNDCLFCHHHHQSAIPGMLHRPPNETCLSCHDATDLTDGPHHAELADRRCVQCHDPHSATNRYLLKGTVP